MRGRWTAGGFVVGALTVASQGAADPRGAPPAPPPFVSGLQHVMPVFNVQDIVNLAHMQKLRARVPQKCGPREVAPGVWVKIDCHGYRPAPNAKPLVFSVGRLRMLTLGQLRLDPGSLNLANPGVGGAAPSPGSRLVFPDAVDHRTNGTEGPVKNQEYTSACTSFALSAAMDNAILRLGAHDVSSPSHLWAHYGDGDMGDAASANLNKPIATWATWPFSPKEGCELTRFADDCDEHYGVATNSYARDAKLEGELTRADANGQYTISSIQSLTMPANPNDLVAVLATGADLWVAFSLDATSWGYQALQQNNNVIPDWSDPEGGHAVMLAGYRSAPGGGRQFLVHNSWGPTWGDGGYAWVSDRMVQRFMTSAYKIKVTPAGSAATPQGQASTTPLTDDDCDSDELVDAVTGRCSPECSDGSRPSNGACAAGTSPVTTPSPVNGTCPKGTVLTSGRCITPAHF